MHAAASQRTWLSLVGCLFFTWLSASPLAAQNTIHVPTDQATIQAAINAASNGDTVLVEPGTYVENIDFLGKAITVTSSGGASVTTIDGGRKGSVVTFDTAEGPASILSGFTITNGLQNGYFGGGIAISGASPTITANVITGNHAAVAPGIFVNGGSPMIKGNTITGNNQNGAGDGYQGGGGIYVGGSSGTPANPQIIGNSITNNSVAAGGIGGGISVEYFSSPLIQNNLIQGNSAYNHGGGIALESYSSPVVAQNVIVNNSSLGGGYGGGMYISPSSSAAFTILNNTISANTDFYQTSGIFVTGQGQNATFVNNIVSAAPNQTAVTCSSSIPPVFSNNDVLSASGTTWAGICGPVGPPGNISADPLFLAATDFHLQWGSPVVDVGMNSAPGLPATDFDGNPRLVDGNGDGSAVVDLGAYELLPTTITLAPPDLTFAAQPVGSTSAAQTLALTNTGSQSLLFSISIDAGFAQTNDCGTSLPAGANCSIDVTFSPAAKGTWAGNLTLRDTASGNPHAIALVGTGGAPAVTLSSNSLEFGLLPVGNTSTAQVVTLSNSGDDVMALAGITTSGDFAQTNTCGATLAPTESCSISVTFMPTAAGLRSGSVNIADNASGAPHTVSLSGSAVVPPITITTQPVSQTAGIGETATFTVVAVGADPLSYQWKKNNVSIPGATSANYTTPPATINDDGATYRVGIQNSAGGVSSNLVTLSVPHSSASIITQPTSLTVAPGQTATFTVVGAGTGPLIYQWQKNHISMPGATSASYTTPPATLADNGTQYAVSVSNSFSGVASNIVTLNVAGAATTPPAITIQPVSQTVGIGQTATFTVVVSGDGTLTYQWKKNNISIPGAISASYTTPPATINDDGSTYKVGIQNNLGGVTSNVVTLSVPHTPASITTQPTSLTVTAGQMATYTVVGAGTGPLIYQWQKNHISIPGATSASYTTAPTTLADDGAQYAVSVSNSFSGVASNVVTLHVVPPPPTYTIGGTVVNLAGEGGGLVLQNNGADSLPINANGSFVFPTALTSGSAYNVTVQTQPSSPAQTCVVTGGTGTVTANVNSITVDCIHNEWAWIGGATTINQAGVYGTLGVPDPANWPGGRQSPVTWTDASGNFWLFGGYGYDPFGNLLPQNDLWKYSGGMWTWMGGSKTAGQSGVYGTQGVAAASNIPGARHEGVGWTDAAGDLWLFGGIGYDSAGTEAELNDLWKYSNGQWTWMGGSKLAKQHGTYGTLGVPGASNTPGGRFCASGWTDSSGALWLFGGLGYDASSSIVGLLNDLWKYSNGQWTWMGGSNTRDQLGTYGTQGVPAASNMPGGRGESLAWMDPSGSLWLYGGVGWGSLSSGSIVLGDLWRYSNGQWTWMMGSDSLSESPLYGTKGVPSATNRPGARQFAIGWADSSGSLWLFGGPSRNDLWRYKNGQWTWMAGANVTGQGSTYGTQGTLGLGNTPSGRSHSVGWVDATGRFWLFGGYGLASGALGNLNDLWMYMP